METSGSGGESVVNTSTNPAANSALFPLNDKAIKDLYRVCSLLIDPQVDDDGRHYFHQRLGHYIDVHCVDGLNDLRTSALFRQCQMSMENNRFDIDVDNDLHQAVSRLVNDKDNLFFISESINQEQLPKSQPIPVDNEHAAELFGDLDYAHHSLQFIAEQAHLQMVSLDYFQNARHEPHTDFYRLDRQVLTIMLEGINGTLKRIQDRATTAAASVVKKEALIDQLNKFDEPVILKIPGYTLTIKGSQPWIENTGSGEGRVLGHDEVERLYEKTTDLIQQFFN